MKSDLQHLILQPRELGHMQSAGERREQDSNSQTISVMSISWNHIYVRTAKIEHLMMPLCTVLKRGVAG